MRHTRFVILASLVVIVALFILAAASVAADRGVERNTKEWQAVCLAFFPLTAVKDSAGYTTFSCTNEFGWGWAVERQCIYKATVAPVSDGLLVQCGGG